MTEDWRPVAGFPGYQVSDQGRVRRRGGVLAQVTDNHGYLHVCLWRHNVQTGHLVHRLVAEAFIGRIYRSEEVNHIDFDKSNNAIGNLEIVERAQNVAHATQAGRYAKKLREQDVRDIKLSMLSGANKNEIAKRFGVTRQCINAIIWNKTWKRVDLAAYQQLHE